MGQKVAIVTTLRDAGDVLQSFVDYHLAIGFDHFFLFFDDPDDPSISIARRYPQVSVIRNDRSLHARWEATRVFALPHIGPFVETEVMARQVLNAQVATSLAFGRGIDWLLHIDVDELFCPFGQRVGEHFESLAAQDI